MLNFTSKASGFLMLLALNLCVHKAFSQDILWEKSCGGKHAEFLYDAIPTPDYGFILVGSSISGKNGSKDEKNKGDLDYWLWKMDEHGNMVWQKSFGGNKVDLLQSIDLTNDGGYILGGTSSSDKGHDKNDNSKGQEDFWVIKLNARGQELWQKTIGGYGMEKLLSIAQTKDGGYILGGTSSSDKVKADKKGVLDLYGKSEDSRGNMDYWIVKLKSDGAIEWQKTIGGIYVDELKSIKQTKDGGYFLGGYSNSPMSGDKTENNFGLGDYWIVKLDDKGVIEWQRTLGGDKDDNLFVSFQTNDGGFILGGNSNSGAVDSKSKSNKKGTDFWVLKLDRIGNIEWQQTYDYGKQDVLTSIVENKDGTFLIGGYAQSEVKSSSKSLRNNITSKLSPMPDKEGINDYIALKIKSNGEEIWTQTVGSKGDELLKKLFETRDGGYLMAGTSNGSVSRDKKSSKGGNDFWIVKLKDKNKPEKPKAPIEAVPNPVQTYTNVILGFEYDTGTAILYDLSGRQLQKFDIKGRTVPFDMSNYPEGIYIVDIRTNTFNNSVKVIKRK